MQEGTIQESTQNGNVEIDPSELLTIPKVVHGLQNRNSLVTFAGGADTRRNQKEISPD